MDKQEVIRTMIEGCTMKLHHLNDELTELEDCLVEIQYMMKEQEYHCNCCKKEDDGWHSNNRRNVYSHRHGVGTVYPDGHIEYPDGTIKRKK